MEKNSAPFFNLEIPQTALLIVDVQDKLFASVERGKEVLQTICKCVEAFQLLDIPIFISEQYPKGLNPTVLPLRTLLGEDYHPWVKTSFSCLDQKECYQRILSLPFSQWIVVGFEAHICVLQTVKSLLKLKKQVTVLNDAISSCSIYDFSTSIAEMRDMGARISSFQTVLFELVKDSEHPQFKALSRLIKSDCDCESFCLNNV